MYKLYFNEKIIFLNSIVKKNEKKSIVKFTWEGNLTFTEHMLAHFIHYLHLKFLKGITPILHIRKLRFDEIKITHLRPQN